MPTRVVVVHPDPQALISTAAALKSADIDAATFADSMLALDALDQLRDIKILIACVDCGPAKPSGITIARMTRAKRPGVRAIFLGDDDVRQYTTGLGELLAANTEGPVIANLVSKMLTGT